MSYRSEIIRRRRGRPSAIKDAGHLLALFGDYVVFVDDNPIATANGGAVERPLTLQGFMTFCGLGYTWGDFKAQYRDKPDFPEVITRVEQAVRANQIEGGLAGIFNSNLTARLNGLSDRSDLTSGGRPLDLKFEIVKPRDEGQ